MKYGPWKIWNGGECPVDHDVMGQVQRAGDTRTTARCEKVYPLHEFRWGWQWRDRETDIIAYREVIEPKRETRTLTTWIRADGPENFYLCSPCPMRAQPVTITTDWEDGQIVGGTIKPR